MKPPKIVDIDQKLVIGMKSRMKHGEFQNIVSLWKQFMPRRQEITNSINHELIALQEYNDPNNVEEPFDIWAAVEVSDERHVPDKMNTLIIPEGLYAVFLHKGMNAGNTYQYITTEWLPSSGYAIDNRPHFQVMGEKYKNGSPDSEEDFYVPIRKL